jgi:hypothetical protein
VTDGYSPIRGKCNYWRERPHEDDRWDMTVKAPDKRIECSCFVEGKVWYATASTIPPDCPERFHCRYYIKHG